MSPFCHSGVKLLWPFKRRSCFPGLKCGVTIATMGAASYMLDSSQNNWFLRYFRQAFTLKALSSFAWWKPPTRGVTRRCRGCGVPSDIWLNSRVLCVYMSVGWLTALSRGWAAMEGMTAFNEHQTLAPVPGTSAESCWNAGIQCWNLVSLYQLDFMALLTFDPKYSRRVLIAIVFYHKIVIITQNSTCGTCCRGGS